MKRIRADFDHMWEKLSDGQRKLYGRAYLEQHISACESSIPTACFNLMRVNCVIQQALFDAKPRHRYLVGGGQKWYDIYNVSGCLLYILVDLLMQLN